RAKGKSAPVAAWEAICVSQSEIGMRVPSATPLVGRRRELTLLVETLERVESERTPQLVTLLGAPGIGKSRLAYELVQSRYHEGARRAWRKGRCLPYGDGVSFWAIAEIVKGEAGIYESDDAQVVAEKLSRAVAEIVPEDEVGAVQSALSPLVGL